MRSETEAFIQFWLSPVARKKPLTDAQWLDSWRRRLDVQADFHSRKKSQQRSRLGRAGGATTHGSPKVASPANAEKEVGDGYISGI